MTFICDIKIDAIMCEPHCIINFLCGLSLHLNHLIASQVRTSYQQFRTLPIGIFCQIWNQDSLRHLPMTFCGHFRHMSNFGDSRAV